MSSRASKAAKSRSTTPPVPAMPVTPWVFTGIPFAPAPLPNMHMGAKPAAAPVMRAEEGMPMMGAGQVRQGGHPERAADAPGAASKGALAEGGAAGSGSALGRKRSASELSALEKRQRRLEKNRESARECRRRKKEQLQQLQSDVAMLEAENLQLRLQLKVGRDAEVKEEEDSMVVTREVGKMLEEGASETQIVQLMQEIQEKFSDYGRDRISAIEFHLKELRRLLLPTMTTKVALWVLLQSKEDMLVDARDWTERGGERPADGQRLELLFEMKQYLGITIDQIEQLHRHRKDGLELESVLSHSDVLLGKLGTLVSEKNATLDEAMNEVQSVLTPTQAARFLVWVANNPAAMHMLNVIWNQSQTEAAPAADEAADEPADAAA